MPGTGRVTRLVHVLAVAFALTILVSRGFSLWLEWRTALERTETEARETAQIIEQYARRVFETSDLVADLVAAEVARADAPAALRGDPGFVSLLRDLSERIAGDYITVFDAEGRIVAPFNHTEGAAPDLVRGAADNARFADRHWFRAHLAGADRVVGTALLSRITGEVLFTYTRALRGPERVLTGVIQVALRPTLFQNETFGGALREGSLRGLWTADGRPLARTGLRAGELGDGTEPAPPQVAIPVGHAGLWRATGPGDQRERLFAHRRLEDWGVVAAAGLPIDTALAPVRRNLAWSVGLLAAVLAALAGLTAAARALDRREQAGRDHLAAANARLREGRDALEASVAERTRALADANLRLRESEARYRGIFNATFQLVVLLRADGTMVEANDAALGFAGLAQTSIAGTRLWDAAWWDDAPAIAARLRDAVTRAAAGEFVRFEATVRGVGQTRTVIDFSLKPAADGDGRSTWLVAEGRDIGALKAAQAQLHEAQKLEVLGQLTGGVAHDFNNLLMAILGNLNLLRKRLPATEPRLVRLIEGAVQGAERGAALTQRLLAFARRQELRPVAVDLAKLTDGMRPLLERSLGAGTRIQIDVPGTTPPVRADPNQLEMALLNLALNARDAIGGTGTIRIDARTDAAPDAPRPAALGAGRFVRLSVVDDGCGMDAATLARATEPFFTTKGPGKGSGLGLSMVHGLAAQSGGHLTIDSARGTGTTVALWLPVSADAPQPAPPSLPPEVMAAARPLAILLVEDDPLIQAGTAAMLEDLGHRVVVAASGEAGLEALRGERFELIITDYAMPGMTGAEFSRRAVALDPELPIILATGVAELPTADASTWPRLAKPYGQQALAAAIATTLERVRGRRAR